MFCGRGGAMSKEHVWPRWLHRYSQDASTVRYVHSAGFERSAADAFSELPTVVKERQGSVLTMKAREVCSSCNNGWMSLLEQRIRPTVLGLIDSATTRQPFVLQPDQAADLAAWSVKTAWMREISSQASPTTTAAVCQRLRQTQLPPEYSAVWIGRHVGERDFSMPQATIGVSRSDRPWNDSELRHALWTCLVFRGLALLTFTVDGWGVAPPQRDPDRWVRLWPAAEAVRFPPNRSLTDGDVQTAVAVHGAGLTVPEVPRFVRDHARSAFSSEPSADTRSHAATHCT
jgi:hypothetical protein